jgi:photosystem II stability/assembly factor-like uncharacterized protein
MKYLPSFFIVILFTLCSNLSIAQVWQSQSLNINGLGTQQYNYTFKSVYFVSETEGWSIGANGSASLILKTSDAGLSWTSQEVPIITGASSSLNCVHFINSQVGWAGGVYGIILKTVDGGETWELKNSSLIYSINSIFFTSNNIGWAVGTLGTILSTTDGGETWNEVESSTNYDLSSITFSSDQKGCIVGSYTILSTQNGGLTWTNQFNFNYNLYSIKFVSSEIGYAVGYPGLILKTTDGGNTWNSQTSPVSGFLSSVDFTSENEGWASGQNGIIIHTTNGGATWTSVPSGTSSWLYSIDFVNSNLGWAVGYTGVIQSTLVTSNVVTASTRNELLVYPIPATDNLTIEFGNHTSLDGYTIVLTNAVGQELYHCEPKQQTLNFDLGSEFERGIYFVRLIDSMGNLIECERIVIL